MMDDLQQAYAAYQNALINLRNPKVSHANSRAALNHPLIRLHVGAQALVRHWHPVRPLWFLGPCRGGLFPGHANAARL